MHDTSKHRAAMTLIALGMILYGYRLAGAPHELFGTYCMAVLAATGLFKAADFLAARHKPPEQQ